MRNEVVGSKILFYDTYALYAIVLGKVEYSEYSKEYQIKTSIMNLYELYYCLLKENLHEIAENMLSTLFNSCVDIDLDVIKEAAKFRYENKKRNLSYIDALGYHISLKNKIPFLTGDKEFHDLPNVIFVKTS